MPTTFTREIKPGASGDATLTWDDMTETWYVVVGTWDMPKKIDATSFSKESKPVTSFTDETKP